MGNCFKGPLLGLTAGFICMGGSFASATNQSIEVAVWGVDSTLQVADVFALLPDGSEVHGVLQPGGTFQLDGLTAKSMLIVEPDGLESVSHEITLPAAPMSLIDVLYVAENQAEFIMDLGPNAKRMPSASPFGGRAPVNDMQSGAVNVACPSITTGTTRGATLDTGMAHGSVPITSPGVWYIVPGTGTTMSASTCGAGSEFDAKLSVFCTGPEQTLIAGNDDSGCGDPLQSALSWCSQDGEHYLILVHGFGGQVGRFQLTVDADSEPCTGGVLCATGDDEILGACCLPNQECHDDVEEEECLIYGGTWGGPGSTCCPQPGSFDGYEVSECANDFESIFGLGSTGPEGDNQYVDAPIGFDFFFFGNTYNSLKMSTNGYLTFGDDATNPDNDACPDPTGPNNYIAPFWDYLFVLTHLQTWYATVGTPGQRQFIAEWILVTEGFQTLSLATFQVVLYEETHCIEFRYHTLHEVPSYEGDVTIGIENADGTWAYCVPDTDVEEGDCISFCPIYTPPTPGQDCPCVTIDFTTDDSFDSILVNGEQVYENVNGLFGDLIHIEAYGSGVDGACIFDTDPAGPNSGSEDPDLLVDTGNALICQSVENPEQTVPGIYDYPNDPSTGGNIEIHFLDGYDGGYYDGVAPQSIDLIDICNTDSSVPLQLRMYDHYGNCRTYSVPRGWTEDIVEDGGSGYRTLYLNTLAPQPGYEATAIAADCGPGWFDQEHVTWIEINGNGSFGVDNLHFCRHLEECNGTPEEE